MFLLKSTLPLTFGAHGPNLIQCTAKLAQSNQDTDYYIWGMLLYAAHPQNILVLPRCGAADIVLRLVDRSV
jgi:hypothetical protein